MRQQLQWYVAWVTVALLRAGEDFDVELLQWPGGSLIAAVFWAGARARMAVRAAARLGDAWRKPYLGTRWLQDAASYFTAGLNPKRRRTRSIPLRERCLRCSR
jgi:hypothetical protein